MSDTPRTETDIDSEFNACMYRDHCRRLRSELATVKSQNDELNQLLSKQQANWEKDLKKCSDELARATESSMAGLRREQQRLADELRNVTTERDALQAKLDTLMLEFCPEEMTVEQRVRWERAQARAKE